MNSSLGKMANFFPCFSLMEDSNYIEGWDSVLEQKLTMFLRCPLKFGLNYATVRTAKNFCTTKSETNTSRYRTNSRFKSY